MRRPIPPSPRPTLLTLAVFACTISALAQGTPPAATPAASASQNSPAQVQLAPLPATEQFSQNVDLSTRPAGESLDALIQALARSVGLSAITQGIPPETMGRYNLGAPKPFREVWDIVLTLNGLEYVLRSDNIVVVGPPETLAGLRPQRTNKQPTVLRTYTIPSVSNESDGSSNNSDSSGQSSSASQLAAYLTNQFPRGSDISITAFDQLGVLSVRASVAQQNRIAQLLKPFEKVSERKVRRTYALSYAKAEDIAGILESSQAAVPATPDTSATTTSGNTTSTPDATSSTDSRTTAYTPGTPGQAAVTTAFGEGEVVSTPDSRTNRVIVLASERVQQEVAELIRELDQPERQVNLQVRIQEVESNAAERMGIDLTAAVGNFGSTLFGGDENSGLSFVFDAQNAISGFNLGAILDVYERQSLSRRVEDSNLTVLNNGTATLQSGGIAYISIPSAGAAENINREVKYGVQLELSPQITNNNEIILNVNGRVDTPVSELDNPQLLNLTTRNLTSRVAVKPGQTIVLGGLLSNIATDATRKVPVLGDVPIVGNLFTTNSSNETNTELLVIVTANVLE